MSTVQSSSENSSALAEPYKSLVELVTPNWLWHQGVETDLFVSLAKCTDLQYLSELLERVFAFNEEKQQIACIKDNIKFNIFLKIPDPSNTSSNATNFHNSNFGNLNLFVNMRYSAENSIIRILQCVIHSMISKKNMSRTYLKEKPSGHPITTLEKHIDDRFIRKRNIKHRWAANGLPENSQDFEYLAQELCKDGKDEAQWFTDILKDSLNHFENQPIDDLVKRMKAILRSLIDKRESKNNTLQHNSTGDITMDGDELCSRCDCFRRTTKRKGTAVPGFAGRLVGNCSYIYII